MEPLQDGYEDLDEHERAFAIKASELPRFYDQEQKARENIKSKLADHDARNVNLPIRITRLSSLTYSGIRSNWSSLFSKVPSQLLISINPWIIGGGALALEFIAAIYRWFKHKNGKTLAIEVCESLLIHGTIIPGATLGALIGTLILPVFGTFIGAFIGSVLAYPLAKRLLRLIKSKPESEWNGLKLFTEKKMYEEACLFLDLPTTREFHSRRFIEHKFSLKALGCHPAEFLTHSDDVRQRKATEFSTLLHSYEMVKIYWKNHGRQWDEDWVGDIPTFGSNSLEVIEHYNKIIERLQQTLAKAEGKTVEDNTDRGVDRQEILRNKEQFIRELYQRAEIVRRARRQKEAIIRQDKLIKEALKKLEALTDGNEWFEDTTCDGNPDEDTLLKRKFKFWKGLDQYLKILERQNDMREKMVKEALDVFQPYPKILSLILSLEVPPSISESWMPDSREKREPSCSSGFVIEPQEDDTAPLLGNERNRNYSNSQGNEWKRNDPTHRTERIMPTGYSPSESLLRDIAPATDGLFHHDTPEDGIG